MKRRINIAVVGIMLINMLLSTNVMAAVQDNQTNVTVESETVDMNNLLEGVLATTQIVIDGELMEVPVVRNIVSTRGIEEKICNTQTICIPDFSKISEEQNAETVAKIKSRAVDHNSFFDNGNYIYFSTELVYNKSRKLADCGDYYTFVDMISFNISREIYTNAPFAGFRNPTAMALQVGPIVGKGGDLTDDIVNQKKEYGSIKFDTTYSIPASWIPMIPGVVDHLTGVRYQVQIIPSSGSSYTIEHWHLAD